MLTAYITLFMLTLSQNCLTSSEDYSAEVVVPNYDLSSISSQLFKTENTYRYPSHYSSQNLIVVLSEIEQGLSIKLQMPTKITEVEKPYIKILSSSVSKPRESLPLFFNGWKIECNEIQCVFEKNLITLVASKKQQSDLTLEFNRALDLCSQSCSGACFAASKDKKCVDSKTLYEIESILRYANVANNFTTVLKNYRVVGSENIQLIEISPIKETLIDWEEAMRQELVWLESSKVISLNKQDIESISSKSSKGQSGNYRIVYNPSENSWVYYADLPDSVLEDNKDCMGYPVLNPSDLSTSPKQIFYLVPIVIAISSILVLILLILIARLITRNKPHKRVKTEKISK